MRRSATLAVVVAAGLLASTPHLAVGPATAQDKKPKGDEEKDRVQKKRDRNLRAIAADFGAKNVDSLLNRVPKGEKISLSLGGATADYAVDQAREVLTKYFDGLQTLTVDSTSDKVNLRENVGVFPLKIRKSGKNSPEEHKLQLTLGAVLPDGNYALAKLADNM